MVGTEVITDVFVYSEFGLGAYDGFIEGHCEVGCQDW